MSVQTSNAPNMDPRTIPAIAPGEGLDAGIMASVVCAVDVHAGEGVSMNASKPPLPVQYLALLHPLVGLKASPLSTDCMNSIHALSESSKSRINIARDQFPFKS